MFCQAEELKTESDVEQKLLWPLMTTPLPSGLALHTTDIMTKLNLRRLEIGKGNNRKLLFPDYAVIIAGLPVLIIEAKAPGEDLSIALDEARMYGNELNARFPAGLNPCFRVIACNGLKLVSSAIDTIIPDIELNHADLSAANVDFARLIESCQRLNLQRAADQIRRRLRQPKYARALELIGGDAFQNEELPSNTFGSTIVGDYGHIFNPRTREDRARIVQHAYVASLRRQRYIEPIDRLIRNAVSPGPSVANVFEDTSKPKELERTLWERRNLENQVLLLIGSVGSGKSTFVDYVSLVALPEEIRQKCVWVRVNLNEAPLNTDIAYDWIARAIINDLRTTIANQDIDELNTLRKIFKPELNTFQKGPLALLDQDSNEYRSMLASELNRLHSSPLTLARCLARYVCAGPGKLLVVVLDNCDKRTRDEQLTMFQIAHWVQTEFKSLVILPIRDVTFERHRNEPPLDTALKSLIFRIEPPPFTEVLQRRVQLALQEILASQSTATTLSYILPNGMRVSYPASDQSLYLASILRSLYEHDRFVRRVMTGLAGRDVRRALEIFLDFCTSGHIGEDEIYKIRLFKGKYVLPQSVVARVLLRMQRRFYDGDRAYVKNLIQCDPEDPLPDHFVRLSILHWLEQRQRVPGPAGVEGFHAVRRIVQDLVHLCHDAGRVRKDLLYLAREGCVVAEHLRVNELSDRDLVRLTASGLVHLQLMANPDYLAACAEDTWLSDPTLADRIANRIRTDGLKGHFSRLTTAKNASDLVYYLKAQAKERMSSPESYLKEELVVELSTLKEAEAAVGAIEIDVSKRLYVGNIPFSSTADEVKAAFEKNQISIHNVIMPEGQFGKNNRGFAFVEVADGRTAMEVLDRNLTLGSRRLLINEAHPATEASMPRRMRRPSHPSQRPDRTLYVGNLPVDLTERSIRDLFESHGFQLVDVNLVINRKTLEPRGYGFVWLNSAADIDRAIGAVNGTFVNGRKITVHRATPLSDGTSKQG